MSERESVCLLQQRKAATRGGEQEEKKEEGEREGTNLFNEYN